MSGAHALAAPSGLHVLQACAASLLAQAQFPEQAPDEDALNGEAAHWGAAERFKGSIVAAGLVAPNGTALTDEMLEAIETYFDFACERFVALNDQGMRYYVEQPIRIPDVHNEHCWGTPDLWLYSPANGCIEVFDFKFGHRFVDEFENWQLIAYTSGIITALGINGIGDQHTRVRLHVAQPRCYQASGSCRTWECMASDLRGFINQIRYQVETALRGDAAATPNEHCIDCRARHACRALQLDAYRSAQISFRSIPVEMNAPAVGLELKFLREAAQRLKARIDGLEQQAQAMFLSGQSVPFAKMVPTMSRQVWAKPVEEIVSLGKLMGHELAKPGAITPKQALAKGMPADIVEMYSMTSSKGLTLAPDDGKEARRIFGNNNR